MTRRIETKRDPLQDAIDGGPVDDHQLVGQLSTPPGRIEVSARELSDLRVNSACWKISERLAEAQAELETPTEKLALLANCVFHLTHQVSLTELRGHGEIPERLRMLRAECRRRAEVWMLALVDAFFNEEYRAPGLAVVDSLAKEAETLSDRGLSELAAEVQALVRDLAPLRGIPRKEIGQRISHLQVEMETQHRVFSNAELEYLEQTEPPPVEESFEPITLGQQLRSRRQAMKFSVRQFADSLGTPGVDRSTVQRWEGDTQIPSERHAELIAQRLNWRGVVDLAHTVRQSPSTPRQSRNAAPQSRNTTPQSRNSTRQPRNTTRK